MTEASESTNAPLATSEVSSEVKDFKQQLSKDKQYLYSAIDAEVNKALASKDPQERINIIRYLGAGLDVKPDTESIDPIHLYPKKNAIAAGIGSIAFRSIDKEVAKAAVVSIAESLKIPEAQFSGENLPHHSFVIPLLGALSVYSNDEETRKFTHKALREYADQSVEESSINYHGRGVRIKNTNPLFQKFANETAATVILPPAPSQAE